MRKTTFLWPGCPNMLDFFLCSFHHLHLASSFMLICIHNANDLCWPMCVPFNLGITYFFLFFHIIAQLVSILLIAVIFKQLHHSFSQFTSIFCSPTPYILHPNIISFIEIWVVCWMHYETPHGCIMKAILSSCAQLCSSFAQICHGEGGGVPPLILEREWLSQCSHPFHQKKTKTHLNFTVL